MSNLMQISDEACDALDRPGMEISMPLHFRKPPAPCVEAVRRLRRSYSTQWIVLSVTPR